MSTALGTGSLALYATVARTPPLAKSSPPAVICALLWCFSSFFLLIHVCSTRVYVCTVLFSLYEIGRRSSVNLVAVGDNQVAAGHEPLNGDKRREIRLTKMSEGDNIFT